MYDINDKFLYEILEDYKDCETEIEKNEIIDTFMKLIWASKNKRRIFNRDLKFYISNDLLNTDIGQIFNTYSIVSYTAYRSMSKNTDFVSLIRQKINNIYTNLCDKRVCLNKEYMDLIKLPKQMYYKWRKGKEFDETTLTEQIDNIIAQSIKVKEKYAKQKMNISWNEYKKLVKPYFVRMFEHYIPLDQFEDKNILTLSIDTWNEDNFAIAYLCKGLDGYMRDYQKKYYGIKKSRNQIFIRCKCGDMLVQSKQNNRFKCNKCNTYQPIEAKTIKCIDCGKEVIVNAKDNKTIRCKECQELANYQPIVTKTIICIDCGEEIEVNGIVKKQERCPECYKKYRNNYQKELMRKRKSIKE